MGFAVGVGDGAVSEMAFPVVQWFVETGDASPQ
jgi:hypothetical protein